MSKKLTEKITWEIEQLKSGTLFTGIYKYISRIYPENHTLLDYLAKKTVWVLDEPARIQESARQMEKEEGEWQTALLQEGEFLPQLRVSHTYEELFSRREHPRI